jgi:calcium permeable stress-gated cation channel
VCRPHLHISSLILLLTPSVLPDLDETRLQQLFHHLPGGVEHVWLNRDLKEMPELYANRLKASQKLESSQTQLIKTALKLRRKEEKASKKNGKSLDDSTWATASQEESDVSLAERLVPAKNRPTHRLPPSWFFFGLPFTGKKVDTIDWCKEEIVKNSEALALSREQLKNDIASPGVGDDEVYPPLNSAFLLFKQQIAAHMAVQSTSHHKPYAMADRYVEMHPKDVIWSNLGLNP